MKELVIIVIISHKVSLSENEKSSLKQCCEVLKGYPIRLICPEGLNISAYKKVKRDIQADFIDPKWQSDYYMFNKLKISDLLYKKYKKYKYILFYELDAFVFRDELNYWCNKGYDYIGAPWNGMHHYYNTLIEGVGNGGFSLRRIKSAIKLLEKIRMNEVLQQYSEYNWKGLLPKLPSIIKRLRQAKRKPSKCEENYHFQEDYFWCNVGPAALSSFSCRSRLLKLLHWLYTRNHYKIAPKKIAVSFSLETNARELFFKNNNTLPFGCHAWEKYEPDFWKEFIPMNESVK